jgi:hypothetical protein
MSINYILEIATKSDPSELINKAKDHFNLKGFEKDPAFLTNSNGLNITCINLDQEDQDNAVIETGMHLNKRIYFSFKNNSPFYCECKVLMWKMLMYFLEETNGDISFTNQGEQAILERRNSVLSINETTSIYYPELIKILCIPYVVKLLEIAELPD